MQRVLLLATVLGLAAACRTARFPDVALVDDSVLEQACRACLPLVREPVRSLQRGVLAFEGTEVDLTLLVRIEPPDVVRVGGLGDLGGTLFQAVRTAAGIEVLSSSVPLEDALLAGLIDDLAALYLGLSAGCWRLARLDAGELGLLRDSGGRRVLFHGGPPAGPAGRVAFEAGGRLRSTARITEWSVPGDAGAFHPVRLSVSDARGRYKLDIHVVDWRLGTRPANDE